MTNKTYNKTRLNYIISSSKSLILVSQVEIVKVSSQLKKQENKTLHQISI